MKTRYIYWALSAIVACAGCEKEAQQELEQQPVRTVLQVGITDTKTYLSDADAMHHRKVYWSNGDQIAVNGTASEALTGLADDTATASFTFAGALSTPYNVLYPASIYTDATHVTLPAIQTYKEGGIADKMLPLAGYSADGSNISLTHLCAVVKISVKRSTAVDADTDNIVAVRFKGKNNEKVSGAFEINYSSPQLSAAAAGSDAEKEVRVAKSLATSTSAAIDYYLVVPARTYANGFDIIVQDVKGDIMTKSKAASIALEPGHLYAMTEFDFVPSGTETGLEISSAEELIAFANAYNNKVFGDDLVATITADLTFDATFSAAFNATGGIGLKVSYYGDAEDYYFNGVFNGNNHSISGLEATCPLFKATSSSALIEDLTIDNTCSFTFTHSKAAELDAGAVVGYHRGTLSNVDVAANVSLAAVESVDKVTALGGLVGREVVGSVENNSSYSGNIVVPAGFQSSDQKIYIGGLVGWISNADGKVKDSGFTGTIDNQGQMIASSGTDDFKNNPQLMIGGIIGLNTGTIDNCTVANHATGVTVILNDGSDHPYTGTVVTHSTNAYHYAIAGIAGRNDGTVKDCTNNAAIVNIFSAARGDDDIYGRYLEVGGIVGYNSASKSVSGSKNKGAIIDRATLKMHRVGGVVGWNYGTVSACENTSTGAIAVGTAHSSPYSARQLYLGGVIGHNGSGSSVSNVQNAAALSVSRIEGNDAMTFIGGVIGQSNSSIDGGGSKLISNAGNIAQSSTCTRIPAEGYNLGGIVGYATAAVSNVSNTGNVAFTKSAGDTGTASTAGFNLGGVIGRTTAAVSSSTNSGRVYMTNSTTGASTDGGYNLGGIAGIAGSTITGCSNSGKVDYAVSAAVAYTAGFNIGGIAGVNNGAVSTSPNSGEVYFANSSTGSAAGGYNIGGIVGAVKANITDSDNTGYIHHYHTGAAATTNIHIGGVAGYMASSATISECDNNTTEAANSGTVYVALNTGQAHTENSIGGILGCTPTSGVNATMENCTNAGKIYGGVNSKQNGRPLYVGGIVAYLAGESSLDNCDNSGEIFNNQANNISTAVGATFNGGIVGYAKGTSDGRITLENCDNTSSNMHSRRGIVGGIVGYAEYVDFTTCSFNQSIPAADDGNFCYWIGGVIGWADYCTLTSCTYSGAELSGTQVQANGVGGMAAQLTNSTVDGCSSSIVTMRTKASGSWANVAGGAIVGVSGSGNTIKKCHYKAEINEAASNVAGTGTFTVPEGAENANVADL